MYNTNIKNEPEKARITGWKYTILKVFALNVLKKETFYSAWNNSEMTVWCNSSPWDSGTYCYHFQLQSLYSEGMPLTQYVYPYEHEENVQIFLFIIAILQMFWEKI